MSEENIPIVAWLRDHLTENDGHYRHRRMDENREVRFEILPRLKQIVFEAHEDARQRLRRIEGVSLDPLEIDDGRDPADGYPERLPMSTLMGYFGEVFAGIVCENFAPLDESDWQVPAHLFCHHFEAFRYLERVRQDTGSADRAVFGRKGDDCLAFVLNDEDQIKRAIFCEAKCLNTSDNRQIASAHRKVSDKVNISLDRQQLIEVLRDSDDPEAKRWVEALRRLRFQEDDSDYERCDLVCYVCGQSPRDFCRIPQDQPHSSYTAGRRLEAVEVYLDQVRQLVRETYERDQSTEE